MKDEDLTIHQLSAMASLPRQIDTRPVKVNAQ